MRAVSPRAPGRAARSRRPSPTPRPAAGQLLLKIRACAVCRTDLHLRDPEIEATKLPVVLGHQIVGRTDDGRRVGVPWLGWTDGTCQYCTTSRENLCVNARFTGRDIDGGYAETDRRRRALLLRRCPTSSPTSRRRRCCAAA